MGTGESIPSTRPRPEASADSTIGSAAADLVARIESGDRQAEMELVERYGRTLAFLLRRWTRDPETAEDLFQETFRRALEKIRAGEVRRPERLSAYLRGLARNISIHHYRRGSTVREETCDEFPVPAAAADQLSRLMRREKEELMRGLLDELAPRDRQVLLRFYLQEEDREPLRRSMGLSAQQFNLVIHRARERYRRLVERRMAEKD